MNATPAALLPIAYVAECFLPGLKPEAVDLVDRRLRTAQRVVAHDGERAEYGGAIVLREDEVMLCLFGADSVVAVRKLCEAAELGFERIVAVLTFGINDDRASRQER